MISDTQLTRLYLRLTRRQRQVLYLVSEGLSNQDVADKLCIAPSVVAGHLTNIYSEIGLLEIFADQQPNRYTAIRLFAGFIERHSEYNPFDEDDRFSLQV